MIIMHDYHAWSSWNKSITPESERAMQEVIPASGKVQHVGKFTLYISPDGQLLVSSGNMRVVATPEEARGMFDYLLQYAQRFQPVSSNGLVPASR